MSVHGGAMSPPLPPLELMLPAPPIEGAPAVLAAPLTPAPALLFGAPADNAPAVAKGACPADVNEAPLEPASWSGLLLKQELNNRTKKEPAAPRAKQWRCLNFSIRFRYHLRRGEANRIRP